MLSVCVIDECSFDVYVWYEYYCMCVCCVCLTYLPMNCVCVTRFSSFCMSGVCLACLWGMRVLVRIGCMCNVCVLCIHTMFVLWGGARERCVAIYGVCMFDVYC